MTYICGPRITESLGGKKYFVTFIADYCRCCAVYFLKNKVEVFDEFKEYEALVTNKSNLYIVLSELIMVVSMFQENLKVT